MKDTGLRAAEIMLAKDCDLTDFAVIACDQFTSEPKYWNELRDKVKGKRTALDLVLPEIFLGDGDTEQKIARINDNIKRYLKDGVFRTLPKGFVLTVRQTPYVKRRIGLVGAIDLEKYEYSQKSTALIRATEGTITERIPPRLEIRKDAPMEFSHAMILFDDEKKEITEKLYDERDKYEKLYDFTLNMGGGKLEGWFIPYDKKIEEAFSGLLKDDRLIKKYGKKDYFAFAVGDGNHSLATAKTHWERVKSTLSAKERENHPARFALCEFVNVYDEGIYFRPIYRFVKGVDRADFINKIKEIKGGGFKISDGKTITEIKGENALPAAIAEADKFIKEYITEKGGTVDYVHGEKSLNDLVSENERSVGIMFDEMNKNELFRFVSESGALPRKTFSMGEATEKRYYLEGRKIVK